MSGAVRNLSQVKFNIKQIGYYLQQLENYNGHEKELERVKFDTEKLISQLEKLPLERFKYKLNQRRRNRRNKKLQKLQNQANTKVIKQNESETFSDILTSSISRKQNPKSEKQLRSVKECQRFLQTFELLEHLHLLRGRNSSETYKFSLKLRQLKCIWNSLLQDKLQEQTSTDVTIQQQWNEVLFGPPEKTYFQDKPNVNDFLRKRYLL